jgi:syntaxin-binding protein 5
VQTYTFSQAQSEWKPEKEPVRSETSVGAVLPNGSFVLDARSGITWLADKQRFRLLNQPAGETHALFVSVGSKGARCNVDVSGERIGKVDWPDYAGHITAVQVIDKLGEARFLSLYQVTYFYLHWLTIIALSDGPP